MTTGSENGYGTMYSLSPRLQKHFDEFLEIWTRFGAKIDSVASPHA